MAVVSGVFNIDDTGGGEGDAHQNTSVANLDLNAPSGNWTGATQTMGEVLKNPQRFRPFCVFNLSGIPAGSTVQRATVDWVVNDDITNALDPYRVGLYDSAPLHSRPVATEDGLTGGVANWVIKDATRNTETVWSELQAIGMVYDDAPASTGDGPNVGATGGELPFETDKGFGTLGAAWEASSTYALGQIRLRISRSLFTSVGSTDANTSRPGTDLFIEVYNVISAADRRPTGSPIATSDTFPWDSLKIGATPNTDPNNWAIFPFTGGPTITSGTIHAYKLVEGAGRNVLPSGLPYIRTAMGSVASNNAAGIFWGVGSWTFCAYPHAKSLPNASENEPGGPLVAGRLFQDDECIVPVGTVHVGFLSGMVRNVWGHDIISPGLNIDHVLDGTGASTTDFVQLLQDWINRPGRNADDDRVAICFDFLSGDEDLLFSFKPQEGIGGDGDGMVLRITYVEPVEKPCDWFDPTGGAKFSGPETGAKFSGPETGAKFSGPETGAKFSGPDTADWFDEQECD